MGYIKGANTSGEGLLGHDIVELLLRDQPVIVGISSLNHFLQFRVIDGFSQLLGYPSKVLNRNIA